MRKLYGSMLNILYLMLNRTLILTLLLIGVSIVAYIIGDVAQARNLAQILTLVMFPLLTVWTARSAYISKWYVFEQNWSASPAIMIISRYIIFAAINLIVSFLWQLSPLFDGSYENLVHTMGSAYLALAIYYPIMYLLKGEKGDLDQIIFIASVLGSIFGLGWFSLRYGSVPTILIVSCVYVISLGLSIGFSIFHKGRTAKIFNV